MMLKCCIKYTNKFGVSNRQRTGKVSGDVQFQGIQYVILFFCVLFLKDSIPYQLLEIRNEQSCAQFSGLRSWERAPAWIPFSDSLQWLPSVTCYLKVIYSVMPLLGYGMLFGPLKIVTCLALLLLNFFYCLKLPCMKIYKRAFLKIKHPCFTRDLGPLHPSSRRLQFPGPGLWRPWYEPKSPTLQVEVYLFFILTSNIHFNWSVFI